MRARDAVVAGGADAERKGNGVQASNYEFSPKTIRVSEGERVSWKATEGTHTVTFRSGFDEGISAGGDAVSKKFGKPGTFRYFCSFHKDGFGMKGKVVVD